jgi:PAS domain S-box-containing protein
MYLIEDLPKLNIHISAFVDATVTMVIVAILQYFFTFRPLNHQIIERIKEAKAFRVQKAYLDQLIENAPEAIVILNNADKVLRINSEFTRMFGYDVREAIGHDINELIVPQALCGSAQSISHSVTGGSKVSLESVRRRKDGSLIEVSILGSPILTEDGQVGVYGIYRDISAQKKMEEKLAKSEKYYRSLIENSIDIVAVMALDGTITYNSPSLEKTLCMETGELIGQSAFVLIHKDDIPKTKSSLEAAVANAGTTYQIEARISHKNGSWRTFQIKVVCVAEDEPYLVVNATDITDRKAAEVKIRQLSGAIEQSPVSVVITDTLGRIEYVNPWFTEITGYSFEEAIGKKPSILKSGHTSDEEYKKLWETITTGGTWRGEFKNKKKNGEYYWESAVISSIKGSNGRIRNYISVKEDITERKLAEQRLLDAKEQAEAAMRAKSDFLATMSHEIRTPMNGVIGMTELLLDTNLTPEQRDFAETIKVSGDSLLSVINDILDYSKIESGKMEFEKRSFNLTTCLENTLDVFSSKAADKKIELIYLIGEKVPRGLIGDETRIKQILMNLINNALKFTESGEVYVAVDTLGEEDSPSSNDSVKLLFKVKDTGIGIPPDKMDRLFKSFSQVDSSTTRKYGGTGLGLAISERLTAGMGGRIWVNSLEGVGSTFSFTIDVGVDKDMCTLDETVLSELWKKRVLIVDDNETNRQILTLQCSKMGMVPYVTGNPLEALEWIGHGQFFDLGILDMHMPVMDGFELGLEIRAMRSHEYLPLVMLSSLNHKEKPSNYPADVFAAHIAKPVKQSQLRDVLLHVLAGCKKEKLVFASSIDADLAQRQPLTILIAEDNPINQKLAALAFEKMGYRVDIARNGVEAVDACNRKDYDIIFMDMQMPEMDGIEATRQILNKRGESSPRIIAMTANAMKEDKEQCLAAGMVDFISKPINIKQIQSKLIEWGESMPTNIPIEFKPSPVIEIEQLKSIGVTNDFFKELVEMYVDQAQTLIGEINRYVHTGELTGFRKIAHTLKGISANIGAASMVEICKSLEEVQAHHRPKEVSVLLHRLGIVYEETRFHLHKMAKEDYFLNAVEAA